MSKYFNEKQEQIQIKNIFLLMNCSWTVTH